MSEIHAQVSPLASLDVPQLPTPLLGVYLDYKPPKRQVEGSHFSFLDSLQQWFIYMVTTKMAGD
jgi:hypothetical protein